MRHPPPGELTRRQFVRLAAIAGLGGVACGTRGLRDALDPAAGEVLLDDVHARLNPTRVREIVGVRGLDDLQAAVRRARREGSRISVAGGRHAMGGQQFGSGSLHLDTRPMAAIRGLDAGGVLDADAGLQWPELIDWLADAGGRFSIVQKQTGADRFTLGGSLSANAHGRGLLFAPLVQDIESLVVVTPQGAAVPCSREENRELFSLVVGGYGLFGLVASVRLRLRPRQKLERVVELVETAELAQAFERRIAEGHLYGDFQFDIDQGAPTFLRRGVLSSYRPAEGSAEIPEAQRELSNEDWMRLLLLTHRDKRRAFDEYAAYYLSTNGQLYWSDTHQTSFYPAGYHEWLDRELGAATPGSEMITELYVPRDDLAGFLADAASTLRATGADLIYGTVRLIERDDVTFLPWAREAWACTVMNLHVDHTVDGIAAAQARFRALIDVARKRGGSYFLTYHRWATREQVRDCHPRIVDFLRAKRRYDPGELLSSDWYVHHREMFLGEL